MSSSNERYYWLKLKEDFFEDDTIQWLEEQENGKEYVIFYETLANVNKVVASYSIV